MKSLNVVHVIQHLGTGGAERFVLDMARFSGMHNCCVTIICLYAKFGYYNEQLAEEYGLKVIYLNKQSGLDINTIVCLYNCLEKIKPDVIHTHMHAAIYSLPYVATHKNTVAVHTIHNMAQKELEPLHRKIQSIAYNIFGVIPIAISEIVRKSFEDEYKLSKDKIPLILNGIDVENFYVKNRDFDSCEVTFVNVASFSSWKNQIYLLECFNNALHINSEIKLVFIGDGVERQNVMNKAEEYGIADKVLFVGITNNVKEWLEKSDVFVLSSTVEGLPLSILEAMAAGLPIISTKVGGVEEIVCNNQNGILVESNNVNELTQALLLLAEDINLRKTYSQNNVNKAMCYDMNDVVEKYINIYRSGENSID